MAGPRLSRPLWAGLAAAAFAAAALSCGGNAPGRPTPVTTLPSTPTTTTPPAAASCPLGMGSVQTECAQESSQLLPHVESAIDMLVSEKPQLVDLNAESTPNTGQYRVLDVEGYLDAMVENLRRQSLCAERDGDSVGLRRILVKNGNAYSEMFDVLSSNGFIRRGRAAYLRTCSPASFPILRTADVPPSGSGCGRPYPPPISRFGCKVHLRAPEYYTGDATPLVGPNVDYCISVGFWDRSICPVRGEGAEDRKACEDWRVGRARDTGRFGPTWTRADGAACTGPESNCANDPDNQYQVRVFTSGMVKAAAESGAYCELEVAR